MASLAERKTPMLIPEATRMEVRVRIKLPAKIAMTQPPVSAELRDEDRTVVVHDRMEGNDLVLDRVFDIPAGRIPLAKYPAFQAFARNADDHTHRDIALSAR